MTTTPSHRKDSVLLDWARARFGRRSTIGRDEMRAFLAMAAGRGLDLSADGYAPRSGRDLPMAWSDICRDITVVSLIDHGSDPGAVASINQGSIRYDQPGQMYPGFLATIMFAPAALRDHPYDQTGSLRRYCRRLLVVR